MSNREQAKSVDKSSKTNTKEIMIWLLIIGIPAIISFIPVNAVFTPAIKMYSIITVAAILMFAFEVFPNFVVAMALPITYFLMGVAPINVVYAPWATTIPWMFIGGFVLSNVLDRIGLLKRVAYWSILKTGGTYNGILYGLALTGIILNAMAPGKAYIPIAALSYGICVALNLGKSKESAGIMLTGFFASYFPTLFLYSPTFGTYITLGSTVTPVKITWLQYFYNNIPFILWIFLVTFIASKVFKPSVKIDLKDYVSGEFEKIGTLSMAEKKSIGIVIALFVFLVTSSMHGIDIAWGFAVSGLIFYLPGINIGNPQDFNSVNYPMVLFVTACLAIGQVASALGLGSLVAKSVLPFVAGKGPTFVIMLTWFLTVVTKFFLTPLAVMATLTVPFTQIAVNLGINPLAFYYTINAATMELLFPYQWALVLIFMSYGLIGMKDFIKIWGIKMVMSFVFFLVIVIPYWKLIGLI